MAETAAEVVTAASVATTPAKSSKKVRAPKGDAKKPKNPTTHPPVKEMVVAAIKTLKERNGSSLQAIKKYIGANYKCDVAKLSPFIKKSLKTGVEKGKIVQTKGVGASGSFKIKVEAKKPAGEKKPKKAAVEKKPKKTAREKKVAKKPAGDKKAVAKKPKAAPAKKSVEKKVKATVAKTAKKAGSVKKAATPKQKPTKASKTAVKKPKTPKPKKTLPAKKTAPKKVVAKK